MAPEPKPAPPEAPVQPKGTRRAVANWLKETSGRFWRATKALFSSEQPVLWLMAVGVGVLSGYAAIGFYIAISQLQIHLFGGHELDLRASIEQLGWQRVILVPMIGGLIVGLILRYFEDNGRPQSVADVIQGARLNQGRMDHKNGFVAAIVSMLSLGAGASAGREGPVVHLGATLASLVSVRLKLAAIPSRTLLGCAVAAAVSASFNAPIAGALFALEVILGHYAVKAFAPIVIASTAGAVVSRVHLGEYPIFFIPEHSLQSYWEMPAFVVLGILCAIVSTMLMWSIISMDNLTDRLRERFGYPIWLEPMVGGALLGGIALGFPLIIGVGYETTNLVLHERLGFWAMAALLVVKIAAVSITLAFRFGGGVFSPSLMLGALTGGLFGLLMTPFFPDAAAGYGIYALAGMGAVAAATLGAPISTSLIVFELTGEFQTAIAVMIAVSVATVLTQQMVERSYFHWRLGNKGLHLGDGPQRYLLDTLKAGSLMRMRGAEDGASEITAWDLIEQGVFVETDTPLSNLLPVFDSTGQIFVPVIETTEGGGKTFIGAVYHIDALRAYNRALVQAHEEEHG